MKNSKIFNLTTELQLRKRMTTSLCVKQQQSQGLEPRKQREEAHLRITNKHTPHLRRCKATGVQCRNT
jgi:hypothetical protein